MKKINNLIPMVVEQTATGERAFDIYSRLLIERIQNVYNCLRNIYYVILLLWLTKRHLNIKKILRLNF